MKKMTIGVVFNTELPEANAPWWNQVHEVIAPEVLKGGIEARGCIWRNLSDYTEPGSIYEANAFAEKLSRLTFPDGTRISKAFSYEGYDLWWLHYDTLFFYFCLPYTQYRKLLLHIRDYAHVHMYKPPFHRLMSVYLKSFGSHIVIDQGGDMKSPSLFPLGVLFQIVLTLLSLPILLIKRSPIMIYTGDEFDKGRDHNFRMKYMYDELRKRRTPFMECIRSIETWKTTLHHAWVRRRPVIYTDAVAFVARYYSILTGGRKKGEALFGPHRFATVEDGELRFHYECATQYLRTIYDDVYAIRIMKVLLRMIGIRAAFMLVATGRNLPTTLGAKLNGIPTIGVLHGVASRHYNIYEFMPAYEGEKKLSVDMYGLWSEWWKEYFSEHSKAYTREQLYVSGPMRPFSITAHSPTPYTGPIRVLFVSELVAVPHEVMPYLYALTKEPGIVLTLKFRPHHDDFEEWLKLHEPEILTLPQVRSVNGGMHEAIEDADVVTGCQSTGVLEALMHNKVPIFFRTEKWGDYYGMTEKEHTRRFFAEDPNELIQKIHDAQHTEHAVLRTLCTQYFGDPQANGSAWAVDRLEEIAKRT